MTPADPLVREYLATSFVARVATRSPAGVPAMTPLWFVAHRGLLYATTGWNTLAARNAAATGEVAILLDGEAVGTRSEVLRLRGRATVHPDLPSWRVLARIARKYYLGGAASEIRNARRWGLRRRYYAQGRTAVIEIAPEGAELLRRPDGAGGA